MVTARLTLLLSALLSLPAIALADELTQIIQQDLVALGYEPGNTEGEATVDTIVAISKFQAEHDLEVTGEASPQLAGIIKAQISRRSDSGGAVASTAPPAGAPAAAPAAAPVSAAAAVEPRDPLELQTAQQACLQQKMAAAQESQERRRGIGRLARAFSRAASELGADGISSDIASLSSDVYSAGAIAGDFKGAAEDLGLTESDIEACRNP